MNKKYSTLKIRSAHWGGNAHTMRSPGELGPVEGIHVFLLQNRNASREWLSGTSSVLSFSS